MEIKIIGKHVVPDRIVLMENDIGYKNLVFTVGRINDGVNLQVLDGYLEIERENMQSNRFFLNKTKGDSCLYFTLPIGIALTNMADVLSCQVVFENENKSVSYRTEVFYVDVRFSVDGESYFEQIAPTVLSQFESSMKKAVDDCQESVEKCQNFADSVDEVKQQINNFKVDVDSQLSNDSENAIQNKVVTENLNKKVDKVDGKYLSTNDFTNEYKEKLNNLNNYDDSLVKATLQNKVDKVDGKGLSSNDYTNADKEKLNNLKNYDDSDVRSILDSKVYKEENKGLSTNDFTNEHKEKLNKLNNYDDSELRQIKQDKLVSGENIKTINGKSVLGGGNIEIDSIQNFITKDAYLVRTTAGGSSIKDSSPARIKKITGKTKKSINLFKVELINNAEEIVKVSDSEVQINESTTNKREFKPISVKLNKKYTLALYPQITSSTNDFTVGITEDAKYINLKGLDVGIINFTASQETVSFTISQMANNCSLKIMLIEGEYTAENLPEFEVYGTEFKWGSFKKFISQSSSGEEVSTIEVSKTLEMYDGVVLDFENGVLIKGSERITKDIPFTEEELLNYKEYTLSFDRKTLIYKLDVPILTTINLSGNFIAYNNGQESVIGEPDSCEVALEQAYIKDDNADIQKLYEHNLEIAGIDDKGVAFSVIPVVISTKSTAITTIPEVCNTISQSGWYKGYSIVAIKTLTGAPNGFYLLSTFGTEIEIRKPTNVTIQDSVTIYQG